MVKTTLLVLLLVSVVLTANVPCTQFQDSKFGTASNCTITRLESNSIQWSTIIHFTADFKWTNSSTSNLLADLSSPRLPVNPSASKCETVEGSYKKGSTVTVNCHQGFEVIPTGYSNVVTAFDGSDYPLTFSTKIPLSMEPSLTQE